VRDADEPDRRAGSCDGERCRHRLGRTDAFERGVDSDAIRPLQDCLVRVLAALGEDVCGAERPGELLAGRVLAESDDPGGAEPRGSDDGRQTHRAVPDDGDHAARPDAGAHSRVVARAHDVGERE